MTDTATITRLTPRRGRCADCLWVCGIHHDQCDHEAVAGAVRGLRTYTTAARSGRGSCGPGARYWQPHEEAQG